MNKRSTESEDLGLYERSQRAAYERPKGPLRCDATRLEEQLENYEKV